MRIDDNEWIEYSRGSVRTTNQRMEMIAALAALQYAPAGSVVTIYSDSAYLVNGMRQRWYDKWQSNGWRNAAKKPVANRDVWERLITSCHRHEEVRWVKVKGHQISSGPHKEMNDRADDLAVQAKLAAIRKEEDAARD